MASSSGAAAGDADADQYPCIGGAPYAIGVAGPRSRPKENVEAYFSAIKNSQTAISQIDTA